MMLWVLFGYLAGSIPSAFLVGRRAGIDVRSVGSGNVGAANLLRSTTRTLGVTAMILDLTKGALSVLVTQASAAGTPAVAAAGAAAIVGHVYPVWLRFHGGKGVAVAAGVFALLAPVATAIAGVSFILVVCATRLVSLGSIVATMVLPPAAWWSGAPAPVLVAAVGISMLILFRHRTNLGRIAAGTERRVGEHL